MKADSVVPVSAVELLSYGGSSFLTSFQRFWHGISCTVLTAALSAVEHLSIMLLLQRDELEVSTSTAGIAGCNSFSGLYRLVVPKLYQRKEASEVVWVFFHRQQIVFTASFCRETHSQETQEQKYQ